MYTSTLFAALSVAGFAAAAPQSVKRASTGTATFYDAGLGACGWTNSASDYVVAVNQAQYEQSNCGQSVTITNTQNGRTTSAQIADLCPSCAWGDLDMSTSLFSYLNDGNMDAGVFSISWSLGGDSTPPSTSAASASPSAEASASASPSAQASASVAPVLAAAASPSASPSPTASASASPVSVSASASASIAAPADFSVRTCTKKATSTSASASASVTASASASAASASTSDAAAGVDQEVADEQWWAQDWTEYVTDNGNSTEPATCPEPKQD